MHDAPTTIETFMDSTTNSEVTHEFLPFFRVYKDGTVVPLNPHPHVPPSPCDPATGVSSKDVTVSPETGLAARIYLPKLTTSTPNTPKLPILVYFHGGGFCIGSAFSVGEHHYINTISSQANALAVSVEYHLAPQHLLPAAYQDCWAALKWVASHSTGSGIEPWLNEHGDFDRVFIAGDSAGGNIAHNIAMEAGREILPNGVRILGSIVSHPYFWESDPSPDHEERVGSRLWMFVHPSCSGGLDDPAINPCAPRALSLAGLGCSRLLVCVAGEDVLRDRGVKYYKAVRESGWSGEAELFESKGEGHVFQISKPGSENTKDMVNRLVSFIRK